MYKYLQNTKELENSHNKNSKTSICSFSTGLVIANKEFDKRNDCLIGVNWICGYVDNNIK